MCTAQTCIFQFSRDSGMQKHDSLGQETICLIVSLCSVRVFTARLHAGEKSNRQDFINQFLAKAPGVSGAPAWCVAHRWRNHWPVLPPFCRLIGWKQIIKREKKRMKFQCCICSIWLWSKPSMAARWPSQMVAPSQSEEPLLRPQNLGVRTAFLEIWTWNETAWAGFCNKCWWGKVPSSVWSFLQVAATPPPTWHLPAVVRSVQLCEQLVALN